MRAIERGRSDRSPLFPARPELGWRGLQSAAIEDIEMLVGHGVGVIDSANLLDYCEQSLKHCLPVVHDDHAFIRVVTRPQKVITLLSPDGVRQAVLGANYIDRTRLLINV